MRPDAGNLLTKCMNLNNKCITIIIAHNLINVNEKAKRLV